MPDLDVRTASLLEQVELLREQRAACDANGLELVRAAVATAESADGMPADLVPSARASAAELPATFAEAARRARQLADSIDRLAELSPPLVDGPMRTAVAGCAAEAPSIAASLELADALMRLTELLPQEA